MDRFTFSTAPVKKVKAIQFGVFDPEFLVSFGLSVLLLSPMQRKLLKPFVL